MSFRETWQRAGEPADDFDPPDDTYTVKIVDGGAWTTSDGREFAKATLEITTGEHTGRRFDDFMNFNNDVGARRARENLALYGAKTSDVEELEDLDTALLELTGTEATVTVKHSPDGRFLNVTVYHAKTDTSDIPNGQEKFDTTDFQAAPAGGRSAINDDDDEIPF